MKTKQYRTESEWELADARLAVKYYEQWLAKPDLCNRDYFQIRLDLAKVRLADCESHAAELKRQRDWCMERLADGPVKPTDNLTPPWLQDTPYDAYIENGKLVDR